MNEGNMVMVCLQLREAMMSRLSSGSVLERDGSKKSIRVSEIVGQRWTISEKNLIKESNQYLNKDRRKGLEWNRRTKFSEWSGIAGRGLEYARLGKAGRV
ncbi:hypothetical protein L6452_13179 [Arctium lappa]|uniref:Uncharacterized protein n=1 Tax=Arctium lappa TaxID=4217 RepID=A0ACB9CHF2_ARCLA|nr:hypothetical protein L6452_13179 [Arctium lappa]